MTTFDVATYMDPTNPDNAAGLQKLGTDVQAAGGGLIEFPYDTDYPILTAAGSAGNQTLVTWQNLKHLRMNFNGSRLLIGDPDANAQRFWPFMLWNCAGVRIDSPNCQQINALARDDGGGQGFLNFVDNCLDVEVRGAVVGGGYGAVTVAASNPGLAAASRGNGFDVSVDTTEVFYPVSFQGNGDSAVVRVKATHPGRSYFPWNVRQHRATVWSDHNDQFQDICIGIATSYGDSTVSNIDVDYVNVADPNTALAGSNGKILIGCGETVGPGGGTISNIAVRFDIASSYQPSGNIITVDDASSTPGSRLFSNIKLGGRITGFPTTLANTIAFFPSGAKGDWVFNVGLEDLDLEVGTPQSITVDGSPFSGAFFMHRVRGWSWQYAEDPALPAACRDFKSVALADLTA
jgi:hypothetical protein